VGVLLILAPYLPLDQGVGHFQTLFVFTLPAAKAVVIAVKTHAVL